MFAEAKLKSIRRKKRILLARNERLRTESRALWTAVGRRTGSIGRSVAWWRRISPALSAASAVGRLCLRRNARKPVKTVRSS